MGRPSLSTEHACSGARSSAVGTAFVAKFAVAVTGGSVGSPQGHVPPSSSRSGGSMVASWTFFVFNLMPRVMPVCEMQSSLDLLFKCLRPQSILTLQLPVTIFICSQICQSRWEGLHNLWLFALLSANLTLENILKMHSGKALMLRGPFLCFSKEWTPGKRRGKRREHVGFCKPCALP